MDSGIPCTTIIASVSAALFSKVGGRFQTKEGFYEYFEEMRKHLPEYLDKILLEQKNICADAFTKRWESEGLPEHKKRQIRGAIIFSKSVKID